MATKKIEYEAMEMPEGVVSRHLHDPIHALDLVRRDVPDELHVQRQVLRKGAHGGHLQRYFAGVEGPPEGVGRRIERGEAGGVAWSRRGRRETGTFGDWSEVRTVDAFSAHGGLEVGAAFQTS